MDCSLSGSSVHGISQARVLEWGAIAFSSVSLDLSYYKEGSRDHDETHTFKGNIPFMWVSYLLPWGTLSIHYTDVDLGLHEPSGLSAKHLPVLERQCQAWVSVPKRHMEAYTCLSQDPIPFPHGIIWAIGFGGLWSFHQPPYHSLAHFPDSSFLSFCPFFEPFLAFQLQGSDFKTPTKVS